MSWVAVAVAVGTASAGAKAIQANQTSQRKKGVIGTAYKIGQERLGLEQGDVRGRVAEQSVQRGLAQGGDVSIGAPVGPGATPGVGGAHTLGAQQTADLAREQTLEQTSLKANKNADLSAVRAERTDAIISGVAGGIQAGVNTYTGGKAFSGMSGATPGMTPMATMAGGPDEKYPGSFGGVDPVNPLGRGAWAPASGSSGVAKNAATTADFNVNV